MKKHFLFAGIFLVLALSYAVSDAQKNEATNKKTKEIIIHKNVDKSTKITVEIDGDSVLVNGKPLSDYHGDGLGVISGDFKNGQSRHFRFNQDDNDMDINVIENDNDNDEDNDNLPGNDVKGPRTFLGVMTEKSTGGITITSIVKNSAAEKAGLQKDDIITRADDKKMATPEDLVGAVRAHKPNDTIKIDYLRNNKKKDVAVKLGETKEKNMAYYFNNGRYNQGGNAFNFKMPPMPKLPKTYYNYKFRNNGGPKLGVKIEDTENGDGAKILNVEAGSAADKAGLKKDDIITEINGEKVTNVEEVKDQLNDWNEKEIFAIKAKRGNADMNFTLKIAKALNSADL